MKKPRPEKPTVLVPYKPAGCGGTSQDVSLYLRPETNGIEVESRLMRVIQSNPVYQDAIELVYLANVPGGFILEKKIVERHYHVKVYFARRGVRGFTPFMKERFAAHFGVDCETVSVLGSFEALQTLDLTPEELFGLWVPPQELLFVCGQSIKRWKDHFIVNYDMPAILSRNNISTDIAVMIFRTSLGYGEIHRMVAAMGEELLDAGLLRRDMPVSRAFHYSKGPFEQILDAAGYLFNPDGSAVPVETSSFYRYLAEEYGFSRSEILGALNQPLMRFDSGGPVPEEDEIFSFTQDDTFETAAEKFSRVNSQILLPVNRRNFAN